MKAMSFESKQGSYSRINYMIWGCGLDGVRMCYIPFADGSLSDNALLLGDIGELCSGIMDVDGRRTRIMELEGWEGFFSTEAPWRRFLKKSEPMRKEGTGGLLSKAGAEMLKEFREMVVSEADILKIRPRQLLDELEAGWRVGLTKCFSDKGSYAIRAVRTRHPPCAVV